MRRSDLGEFCAAAAPQRSLRFLLAGSAAAGVMLFATQALALNVASQADWNTAAAAVAAAGAGSTVTINVTSGFTLTSSLAQLQASNANVTVNVTGNSNAIDGASAFQGIQVNGANALTVNLSNLTVKNAVASGGAGGAGQNGFFSGGLSYGSGGGGGGGSGAGGGLYVGAGAKVTVASVTFTNNNATGGTGGNGGVAQNTASSPTGGNGGDGGALNGAGAVGGGGAGGLGGNTGTQGTVGTAGSTAGAGGGGGGGSGTTSSTAYTPNNNGGAGNSNGGNGAAGGDGVTNNQGSQGPGADGGSGGNGGAGQGGAIYVQTGGTLTILNGAISGSTVAGGAGGAQGVGQGPSEFSGSPGGTGSTAGAGIFLNGVTANIGVSSGGTMTYADTIGGTGLAGVALNKTGAGTLILSATNTFTGAVGVSGGTLTANTAANLGNLNNTIALSGGGIFGFSGTATLLAAHHITVSGTGGLTAPTGTTLTISSVISDGATPGNINAIGPGTIVLAGINTQTGGATVSAGTLKLSGSGTLGAASGTTTVTGGVLDLNGTTQTQAALALRGGTIQNGSLAAAINSTGGTFNAISGGASLTTTAGVTTLTGANTYTGGTNVNGGILNVTGSLADPAVNAGGMLMGTGSVGATQVNSGGILEGGDGTPGTTLAVNGALTFAGGGILRVQVSPMTASLVAVTGAATLGGGTVNAVFANGSYIAKKYTILTASTGVTGTFAPTVTNTNLPATFATTLSYDANDAYLNLALAFVGPTIPGGLNQNQTAVGGGLVNSFNTTGGIPLLYGTLTAAQLSQASGELATASQQTTFDAMDHFMGLMQTNGMEAAAFNPAKRLNVWAAGLDNSRTTNGATGTGSNKATDNVYGGAVGADYAFGPDTVVGGALGEGGTTFSLANVGGSGKSNLFQAGGYARQTFGAAYVTASAAYGWQDITTKRTVTISGVDQLQAEFKAHAYSARIEGGYRYQTTWTGITPFLAVQDTGFSLPGYNEKVTSGSANFALGYQSKDASDLTSELGLRTDNAFPQGDSAIVLKTSLAWQHDYDPKRNIGASFLALPASTFVVNGAAQAQNSALANVSVGMKWRTGWSVTAGFQGDFSNQSSSYGGLGVVRYAW